MTVTQPTPRRPRWKRLDTDLWAIVGADDDLRGGDYRPYVYWTRSSAKEALPQHPHCRLVRVRIVVTEP